MVSALPEDQRHHSAGRHAVLNGTGNNADEPLYDNAVSPLQPPEGTSTLRRVLQFRQLHCADQLFATSDYEILSELVSA